ncbi:hypothetical protein GCM10027089_39920 [Nocardia thraciensis]
MRHASHVVVGGPHSRQVINNWRPPPDKRPPHRVTPWLIAAAVFGVVGLLVVYAVLVNIRNNGSEAPGPELAAIVTMPDRDGNGFNTVVPGRYRPQAKFMTMSGAAADDEFASDLYRAGGVCISG